MLDQVTAHMKGKLVIYQSTYVEGKHIGNTQKYISKLYIDICNWRWFRSNSLRNFWSMLSQVVYCWIILPLLFNVYMHMTNFPSVSVMCHHVVRAPRTLRLTLYTLGTICNSPRLTLNSRNDHRSFTRGFFFHRKLLLSIQWRVEILEHDDNWRLWLLRVNLGKPF